MTQSIQTTKRMNNIRKRLLLLRTIGASQKNRARLLKEVKDQFGRIKKRVARFCDSWKEANALWPSGESDVDLMDRALKLYEDEHKKDDPFYVQPLLGCSSQGTKVGCLFGAPCRIGARKKDLMLRRMWCTRC